MAHTPVYVLYSTQGPRALVSPPSIGLYLRGVHYSSLRETLESKISRILKAIRKNKSLVCRQHWLLTTNLTCLYCEQNR